jgi:hypothetical protein
MKLSETWQKATACSDNACLEARQDDAGVSVRNNTKPGDVIVMPPSHWMTFITVASTGEFDLDDAS